MRNKKNHKTVPRVGFLLFCRSLGSLLQQERSRKEQPSKSVAGPVLTAFARYIATRCRAALSGTRGRRGEMISSLAFFSLPTPPSDLFAIRVCVCRHILTQCTWPIASVISRTFSFVLSNFNIGTLERLFWLAIENSDKKHSIKGMMQIRRVNNQIIEI